MKTSDKNGFTLMEIMIVTAVIGVLIAISVALLSQGVVATNEASAIVSLRAIRTGQNQYRMSNSIYATLDELNTEEMIDPALGKGTKSGYRFETSPYGAGQYEWYAQAVPQEYASSGSRSFYLDQKSVIRAKDTGGGDFKPQDEAVLWPPMQ